MLHPYALVCWPNGYAFALPAVELALLPQARGSTVTLLPRADALRAALSHQPAAPTFPRVKLLVDAAVQPWLLSRLMASEVAPWVGSLAARASA